MPTKFACLYITCTLDSKIKVNVIDYQLVLIGWLADPEVQGYCSEVKMGTYHLTDKVN